MGFVCRLTSPLLWFNLSAGRLAQELKAVPKLKRHLEAIKKQEAEGRASQVSFHNNH